MSTVYTMAFVFDTNGRVALIRKNRPDYLAGKWNGIGGKVEETDTSFHAAAVRELREESGLSLHEDAVTKCGIFAVSGKYEIHVFQAVIEPKQLDEAYTATDETVMVFEGREVYGLNMDQHSLMFYQAAVISRDHHANHRSKFEFISF